MKRKQVVLELVKIAKSLIAFRGEPIFDYEDVAELRSQIEMSLQSKAPFVKVTYSTLGGKENVSFLIAVSLDPKEDWTYGIIENSRLFRVHLNRDGELEQFQKSYKIEKKLRKSRVKSVDAAIRKLAKYIDLMK